VKFRDGLAMPLLTLPPSSPFEFAVEVNGVTTPQLAIGPCVMVPGSAGRPLVGPSDAEVAWAEEAPNVGDWEKLPPRATCPAPPPDGCSPDAGHYLTLSISRYQFPG
jgi:hypothetical protein